MTDEAMSPLRRRMIEDMTIRKFAPKTQHDYVQRVKNFAAFLGRSPDTASFESGRRATGRSLRPAAASSKTFRLALPRMTNMIRSLASSDGSVRLMRSRLTVTQGWVLTRSRASATSSLSQA